MEKGLSLGGSAKHERTATNSPHERGIAMRCIRIGVGQGVVTNVVRLVVCMVYIPTCMFECGFYLRGHEHFATIRKEGALSV